MCVCCMCVCIRASVCVRTASVCVLTCVYLCAVLPCAFAPMYLCVCDLQSYSHAQSQGRAATQLRERLAEVIEQRTEKEKKLVALQVCWISCRIIFAAVLAG